jgi:2-polyprenyl-6-methoxyphenol hydroxylase-like FAD-dependent oxidoreductase
MMAGYLLARAGIDVVVLEKHADFLRDFRGDTVHPSTLDVMNELGLLQGLLARPHSEVRSLAAQIGNTAVQIADFSHLPTKCRFVAFMPQWDFLDYLAAEAKRYPAFRLMMRTEATGLIAQDGRVLGVTAQGADGELQIRSDLVIAADGRHSALRAAAGFTAIDSGAPMDVLWLRLPRRPDDSDQALGRIGPGRILIQLNRGDSWQCAYVIAKGGYDAVRAEGLNAFRAAIARLAPELGDRVQELASWDDVKLLTVAVNRLPRWYKPGLLCIGDAAHAMSPIGGVGINLAIQDAVAAANILEPAFRGGVPTVDHLAAVQRRRELPTRLTQRVQLFIQHRVIAAVLHGTSTLRPPFALRLLNQSALLRRIPARLVGMGFRPEHVHP